MENIENPRRKILLGILTSCLALTSVLGFYSYNHSNEVTKEKEVVTFKKDSLMALKEKLEFEIDDLSKELEMEKNENKNLSLTVEKINTLLADKEKKMSRLNNEIAYAKKNNVSYQEQIALLNTQILELKTLKETLEKDLLSLQDANTALTNENTALKAKNEELTMQNTALTTDVQNLNKNIEDIKYEAPADNFRVEVLKPNAKLTAKAKKVRTLKISFLVPQNLRKQSTGKETLYMTILDEKKNPIKGVVKEINLTNSDKIVPIAVHSMKEVDFSGTSQAVEFMFDVKEKLTPGTYTVSLYTDNDYLGTTEFAVAKSFWFF